MTPTLCPAAPPGAAGHFACHFPCCGRYRIGYRQLFPGKIVVQRHPPGGSQFRFRRAYPSGADDLPRTQAVQHLGQLYPFA